MGEVPPMDGTPFYALVRVPMRYRRYKPGAPQLRQGIKGRWQQMNEFGGWENCAEPNLSAWEHHPDFAPLATPEPEGGEDHG
ncbi:hypothetical protein [Caulobacter segnis]